MPGAAATMRTLPAPPRSLGAPADVREAYRLERDRAIARFRAHPDPDALTRALTVAADRALRALWRRFAPGRNTSLAAVGGFGRREQFPHSDVDLMVLTGEALEPEQASRIEAFIGACWDCGLPIGHSVRSVDQCVAEARADVTVQTSLLELRWLAGSRRRCLEAAERLQAILDPQAFFSAKLVEMRQRHAKYDDTPYSLEPNTKESPGGLRDLQMLVWIARAAGLGRRWHDLAEHGLITAREAAQLRRNERRLKRIRAMLHIVAGRHEDRLVFDLQAQVAGALGLGDADPRSASEELMQRYYWAAKAVVQLNTIVLQNLRSALFPARQAQVEPIDALFRNVNGLLDAVDPHCFEREPSTILRAFRTMQDRPELVGIATPTLRALWNARTRIDAAFRRDPANRAMFLQILQAPRGITHELRRMNQWSILGHYLPPFRRIVGRMQHDLFHVYTVDQHILMVVRNLRRFTMPEHAHEYPFCSELMAGFAQPWLLYVAALFHDIAKGRGGDHSVLGRIDARRFCRDHGMSDEDTALVEFLVLHHLALSSVAQKQDTSDPEVVARFAALVGSERRLVALYLLTVADIRGTSPKVWNAWKGKLLEELFLATRRALQGHAPSMQTRVDAVRDEAARVLALYGLEPSHYARFWQQLDVPYFLRHAAQDISWHVRVLHAHVDTRVPIVRTRLSPVGEGIELVVYLPDQPDLFARICGYFDSRRLSVLEARIHTTRHGYALDTFVLVEPGVAAQRADTLVRMQDELAHRLATRDELAPPVEGRSSRRSRHFPVEPSVELQPDERGGRFLLSVVANDRTGLLYRIARVLARYRINVQTARITTLGERVEDVFLVDGAALEEARESRRFQTELLEALR